MSPIVAFVLGLLIGWLVELVIDWIYWRRHEQWLRDSIAQCRRKVAVLDAEISSSRNENQTLQEKADQLEMERARQAALVVQAQQELETLRAQSAIPQLLIPDNLEEINGIGPVIAKRLNQAGIFTFEQLAAQTPEFLRNTLGDVIQRLADEEELIAEARMFAERKQSKGASGQ